MTQLFTAEELETEEKATMSNAVYGRTWGHVPTHLGFADEAAGG